MIQMPRDPLPSCLTRTCQVDCRAILCRRLSSARLCWAYSGSWSEYDTSFSIENSRGTTLSLSLLPTPSMNEHWLGYTSVPACTAIAARGQAGDSAKGRAEGAGVVVSDTKANVSHRGGVLCQQCLGAFDALAQLIAFGRYTEGLTEGAAEIPGAQAHH